MLSKTLKALPDGTYVRVRFLAGEETVRLLGVRPPMEKERSYGHSMNRVDVRRFLLGGWRDTWVFPRDVLSVATPDESTLAAIDYVEREVGPADRGGR